MVAMESQCSSSEASSSETLATSPMYINPDMVDFFSTGSLVGRGTLLEPPAMVDPWKGEMRRRSLEPAGPFIGMSGSFPGKSSHSGNRCGLFGSVVCYGS